MTSAEDVWGATLVNRSSAAAIAFLVWDVLITFGDEVDLVWSKPHTFRMKWLFLFVRYFAVALQLSLIFDGTDVAKPFHYTLHACRIWYIFQEVSTQVLIAAVEIVLMLRVQAIYHRQPIITNGLYALFLAENTCMVIALVRVVPGVEFDEACIVTRSPFGLVYFAAAFISFETLLFVLTLVKFISALYAGWGDTPVLTLLVRDGTWAFALIFAVLCINAAFFLGAPNAMAAVAYQWLISVESFAGARLILNVLALEESHNSLTTSGTQTSIRFTSMVLAHRTDATTLPGESIRTVGESATADVDVESRRPKPRRWKSVSSRVWSLSIRTRGRGGSGSDTEAFEMSASGSGSGSGSGGTYSSG